MPEGSSILLNLQRIVYYINLEAHIRNMCQIFAKGERSRDFVEGAHFFSYVQYLLPVAALQLIGIIQVGKQQAEN
ncbi:hypothetical protein D3C71_2135550 [compost metagenome]